MRVRFTSTFRFHEGPVVLKRAVLLDLYDTLVRPDWWGVTDKLCRGLGVTGERLLAAFQATHHLRGTGAGGSMVGDLRALAGACGLSPDDHSLAALAEETGECLARTTHVYEDVVPTLQELRARGVPVALVSNCDHATAPLLRALGLDQLLDVAVLSCEVGCVKPDARIFQEALGRLGVPAEQSLFVDDQPRFLDGAAALGIATFHIVRPEEASAGAVSGERSTTSPHRHITSLAALLVS